MFWMWRGDRESLEGICTNIFENPSASFFGNEGGFCMEKSEMEMEYWKGLTSTSPTETWVPKVWDPTSTMTSLMRAFRLA